MSSVGESPFRDKGLILNGVRASVRWLRCSWLKLLLGGRFSVGEDFSVGRGADIRPPRYCRFGDRVGVGKNVTIECDLSSGDDVLISSNVSFVGNDHKFDSRLSTVFRQGRNPPAAVVLEGDNLIGFGAIVIAPCVVERGAIVAAGAVVKNRVTANSIYGGVPAKLIRGRFDVKV